MNKKIIPLTSLALLIIATALIVFGLHQKGDDKMEKKDIRVEKFEKLVPPNDYDFNFKLAESKGYSTSKENVTPEYLELQSKYDQVLSVFLEEKLSIAQLNSQLDALGAIKVPKTSIYEMDSAESYYRNNSHLNSEYFYLRNNIKIERLKKSDVELLNTLDLNNPDSKEKLIEMVSRTLVDVLRVELPFLNKEQQQKDYKVGYTNDGTEFVGKNAIVFWLSTQAEYDSNGNQIHRDEHIEKSKKIEMLAEEYSSIFSEELNYEVKIFVHDGE